MLGLLTACGFFPPVPSSPTVKPLATLAPTARPSPSPTLGTPLVEVVSPELSDPSTPDGPRDTLLGLADSSGMDFTVVSALVPADLPREVVLLIVLDGAPAEVVRSIAAQRPDVRVVAIATDGLTAGANLTLLEPPDDLHVQQAFLAGFTSVVVTPDWRVAALLPDSDPAADQADAFRNGGVYFCGLCRPVRPPFLAYPLQLRFSPGSSALAGLFDGTGVVTVFVPASAAQADLYTGLASAGLGILGTEPPPPALASAWIGSLMPDPVATIAEHWTELTGSQPPASLTMPVVIQNVNPELLSPGRLRLVEQTQSDLASGWIDPLSSP